MTVASKSMQKDMVRLDNLYMYIMSVCSSYNETGMKRKQIDERTRLAAHGLESEKQTVALLKESNNRLSMELLIEEKEYGSMKELSEEIGELAGRLRKMDMYKAELGYLRRHNSSVRIKLASITTKIWSLQEEHFNLKKEREREQNKHNETMKLRGRVIALRPKVLPLKELLDLKDSLAKESAVLENDAREKAYLKTELARCIPQRDESKERLDKTIEAGLSAKNHIIALKGKIAKLSSRIVADEEVKRWEEESSILKEKKMTLTKEKKELSPKMATITEEEENLSTIHETYKQKIVKERDKLKKLKLELKKMDVDKTSVSKLRDEVSSAESDLEIKKKEMENVKKEYNEVTAANQRYKATIEEVEKGTKKLKKMMGKK